MKINYEIWLSYLSMLLGNDIEFLDFFYKWSYYWMSKIKLVMNGE